MLGGEATISWAVLLAAPAPPLVELTGLVVLDTVPDWVPVTFTVSVQVVPGVVMVPPVRLITVLAAVATGVPPHEFTMPGVAATCNPLCSVSLNATPFSAVVLAAGLVMVKVTVVVPFSEMLVAPKALLIVGGATTFSNAVLLVAPVPLSLELIVPVVLFWSPAAIPITVTVK